MDQERKESNIQVVKFSAVELPKFVEKNDKDYVFYGLKNDYPYYLLTLYNKSVKHSAVINGKMKYIFGQGWTINRNGINPTQTAQYTALMQSVNDEGESLDEISYKVFLDWILFGGYSMEVIWNKAGTKVVSVKHIPFAEVRQSKSVDEDGKKIPKQYYYTSEWYKTTESGKKVRNDRPEDAYDFEVYDEFNPDKVGKAPQLFYYKSYSPSMESYPLPEYIGKIAYIEIDIGISTFWNSLIKRGFTASHIITFMSGEKPTDEAKRKINEKIEKLFGGAFSDNAGGFIVEYASDKDHTSVVNTLQPTDMDKQYDLLNKTTEQQILMGINPMLFGIKTEGQLGGRTEIIEANELFQNVYVSPKQQELEKAFNYLFSFMGLGDRLKLTQLEPIGYQFSESIIEKFLPAEAIREMIADRMGIDLKKYAKPVQVNTPGTNFSSQRAFQIPTDIFEGLGEASDKYEVLFSIPMDSGKTLDEYEAEAFSKYETFAAKLSANELAILDLLKKDPLTTPDVIAKVVKMDESVVKETIKTLTKSGHIKSGDVTGKGSKAVSRSDVKTENIFVKYRYGWNPLTDNSDNGKNSRPFCKFLLGEKKLYTRKELESLNTKIKSKDEFRDAYGDLDVNVWEHRGGWYRAPGSDVSVPQCRHLWEATVVREK